MRSSGPLVLSLLLVSACKSDEHPDACPPPEPAFELQVTAGGNLLPSDTHLVVEYQGNQEESFTLTEVNQNDDVCCQRGAPVDGELQRISCAAQTDAGLGATASAIQCTLWTNGPATVHIEAAGYLTLEETLNSRLREDQCGVETVEQRLVLGAPDGGI